MNRHVESYYNLHALHFYHFFVFILFLFNIFPHLLVIIVTFFHHTTLFFFFLLKPWRELPADGLSFAFAGGFAESGEL